MASPALGLALCIAYILGLVATGISLGTLRFGALAVTGSGLTAVALIFLLTWLLPRPWKQGLRWTDGLILAGMALLAMLHIGLRSPHPSPQDISHYVERAQAIASTQIVLGQVVDEPQLNRSLKGRFRLAVDQLKVEDAQGNITFKVPTRGQVYVTAPLRQVTGLHQGQWITAKGRLYEPQINLNPGGFDFKTYLAKRRTFGGFVAEDLNFRESSSWGLWRVRQRIVRAQVRALGSPLGQLVSAMALGRRAVDLPFDIQDLFARVGLAHTIAASGFHVSLLLGTVLALVRSQSNPIKLGVGVFTLGLYLTLTGIQPSVSRAVLMGLATLLGMVLGRKVKSLGALLCAVTLLLVFDPNWIWDIGFQLSVAATFGLIVTAEAVTKQLDWLPTRLAPMFAVPIAATLWTLPLMLYHFNVISGFSILLNALSTPLVAFISLGAIGSSTLALLSPFVGKLAASLLYYPGHLLLWLAQASSRLPGSAIATGQIAIWQLAGLYSLLALSLFDIRKLAVKRLLPVGFLSVILLPIGWQILTQYQITVLAAGNELIWMLQDHGRTTLVSSGDAKTVFYTVQPFLQQAGVNRIDRAIAPSIAENALIGWQTLLRQTPITHLYGTAPTSPLPESSGHYHALAVGQSETADKLTVQSLGTENPILRLTTTQQSWLLLPQLSSELQNYLATAGSTLQSQVLVWPGDKLSEALLSVVQPEVVICYGKTLPKSLERNLERSGVQVYWTARDGAVIWRNRTGFRGYLETKHRNALPQE